MWEWDFCAGPKLKHTFLGQVRQTGHHQRLSKRIVETARMAERVSPNKTKCSAVTISKAFPRDVCIVGIEIQNVLNAKVPLS